MKRIILFSTFFVIIFSNNNCQKHPGSQENALLYGVLTQNELQVSICPSNASIVASLAYYAELGTPYRSVTVGPDTENNYTSDCEYSDYAMQLKPMSPTDPSTAAGLTFDANTKIISGTPANIWLGLVQISATITSKKTGESHVNNTGFIFQVYSSGTLDCKSDSCGGYKCSHKDTCFATLTDCQESQWCGY